MDDPALLTVWALALLAALVLTVLMLPVIVRVIHTLREIDRLASATLTAAVGIADNTASIAALDAVLAEAGRLLAGVQRIGGVSAGIHQRVAEVGAALGAGEE